MALYFGSASIQRLAIRAPRFSVFDDSSPDHKSHLMGLISPAYSVPRIKQLHTMRAKIDERGRGDAADHREQSDGLVRAVSSRATALRVPRSRA